MLEDKDQCDQAEERNFSNLYMFTFLLLNPYKNLKINNLNKFENLNFLLFGTEF